MNGEILKFLRTSEEGIVKAWMKYMQPAGYQKSMAATPADFHEAFEGVLSILDASNATPSPSQPNSFDGSDHPRGKFVLEAFRRHKARGVNPGFFGGCFKTLFYAMEDSILDIEISDREKTDAVLKLRRIADAVETAVVGDWMELDRAESTRQLEQAYRRLVRDKNRYKAVYNITANPILIINPDGVIIEANPRAFEYFSGNKIIGRFCGDLFDLSIGTLEEFLLEFSPGRAHEILLNTVRGRLVFHMHVLPMEQLVVNPGLTMLLLIDVTPMVDRRIALERGATEKALAQATSEKILGAIFMSVGVGIVLVDEELEIVKANQRAEEIFGVLEQNLIGTDVRSLFEKNGALEMERFFDELMEGQHLSSEMTGLYVDGRMFPATVTVTRIDFGGKTYWPIIIRDDTDQRTLENQLRREKKQTEEMNLTLKNVMKSIEEDRRDVENRVASKIRTSILPALKKLEGESDATVRKSYLTLLEQQLLQLTAGFATELDAGLLKLSKTEIQVCRFIQAGNGSKEISDAMKISFDTIQTHRKNIRKKLGLNGKKMNLHAFLVNRVL